MNAITALLEEKIYNKPLHSSSEGVADEVCSEEEDSRNLVSIWLSANCTLTGVHEDKHTVTDIHEYHKENDDEKVGPYDRV